MSFIIYALSVVTMIKWR